MTLTPANLLRQDNPNVAQQANLQNEHIHNTLLPACPTWVIAAQKMNAASEITFKGDDSRWGFYDNKVCLDAGDSQAWSEFKENNRKVLIDAARREDIYTDVQELKGYHDSYSYPIYETKKKRTGSQIVPFGYMYIDDKGNATHLCNIDSSTIRELVDNLTIDEALKIFKNDANSVAKVIVDSGRENEAIKEMRGFNNKDFTSGFFTALVDKLQSTPEKEKCEIVKVISIAKMRMAEKAVKKAQIQLNKAEAEAKEILNDAEDESKKIAGKAKFKAKMIVNKVDNDLETAEADVKRAQAALEDAKVKAKTIAEEFDANHMLAEAEAKMIVEKAEVKAKILVENAKAKAKTLTEEAKAKVKEVVGAAMIAKDKVEEIKKAEAEFEQAETRLTQLIETMPSM